MKLGGADDVDASGVVSAGGEDEVVGGADEVVGGADEVVGGADEVGGAEEVVGGADEVGGAEEVVGGVDEVVGGADVDEDPHPLPLQPAEVVDFGGDDDVDGEPVGQFQPMLWKPTLQLGLALGGLGRTTVTL